MGRLWFGGSRRIAWRLCGIIAAGIGVKSNLPMATTGFMGLRKTANTRVARVCLGFTLPHCVMLAYGATLSCLLVV